MRKYSIKEVAEIVENEGLGYAITSYLSHEAIEDDKLAGLWKQAGDVLTQIDKLLEPHYWN